MNVSHWPLAGLLVAMAMHAQGAATAAVYTQGGANPAAMACVTCHGAEGEGMAAAGFPRLAGLSAGYMKKQLADFASGERANPIMQPIAAALSSEEADAVTTMLAGKPQPAFEPIGRAAEVEGLGETLALRGHGSATFLNALPATAPAAWVSATPSRHSSGSRPSTCLHSWSPGNRARARTIPTT